MHLGNDMSISASNFGNGVTKLLKLLIPVAVIMLSMLLHVCAVADTDNDSTYLYGVFLKYDNDRIVAKLWRVSKVSHEKVSGSVLVAGERSPVANDSLNWDLIGDTNGHYEGRVRPLLEEYNVITDDEEIRNVYDFLRYLDTLTVQKEGKTEFADAYLTSLSYAANNRSNRSQAAFRWFSGDDSRALNSTDVNLPNNINKTRFAPLRENDLNTIEIKYTSLFREYVTESSQSEATNETALGSDPLKNDNESSFINLIVNFLLRPLPWLIIIFIAALLFIYKRLSNLIEVMQRKSNEIRQVNHDLRDLERKVGNQKKASYDDQLKRTPPPSTGGWKGVREHLDQTEAQKGWKDPGRSDEKEVPDNSLSLLKEEIGTIGDRVKEYHSQHEDMVQEVEKTLNQFTLETIEDFESVRNEVSEVSNKIDRFRENTLENFKKLKSFNKRVEIEQIDRIADIKQSNAQKSAFAGLSLDLFESWFKEHPQLGEILTDQVVEEIKSKLQHLQKETQVLTEQKRFAEALIGFCDQEARGDLCKAIITKLRTVCEQADGIQLMINEGRWDSGHLQYLAQLGLDTDENATSPLNQFATALATFVLLAKDPEGWIKKQSSFLEESVVPQLILMTFGSDNEITSDSERLVAILHGAGMEIIRPSKGSDFEDGKHEVFGLIPGGESGKIARVERPGLMNSDGGIVLSAIVELYK